MKENRTLQLQIEHCRERLRQRFLQQEIAQHRLKARLAEAVRRFLFQRVLLPEPSSQRAFKEPSATLASALTRFAKGPFCRRLSSKVLGRRPAAAMRRPCLAGSGLAVLALG